MEYAKILLVDSTDRKKSRGRCKVQFRYTYFARTYRYFGVTGGGRLRVSGLFESIRVDSPSSISSYS